MVFTGNLLFMDVYFEPDPDDAENKNWLNQYCFLSRKKLSLTVVVIIVI